MTSGIRKPVQKDLESLLESLNANGQSLPAILQFALLSSSPIQLCPQLRNQFRIQCLGL